MKNLCHDDTPRLFFSSHSSSPLPPTASGSAPSHSFPSHSPPAARSFSHSCAGPLLLLLPRSPSPFPHSSLPHMASLQRTADSRTMVGDRGSAGTVPFVKDPQGGRSALSVNASPGLVSSPAFTGPVSCQSESDRENEEDALVPSLSSFKAPAPVPEAASAPKSSFWDDSFYKSTPTPKPPPRLAPMPKSPLSVPSVGSPSPPPLVISTHMNTRPATPIIAPAERQELMGVKSRYATAYHAHNRSSSYSQAHSNHDNNIFALPSDSIPNSATGGSPSLASLSTSGKEGRLGAGFNSDMASHGGPVTRSLSNTALSHTSLGTGRSSPQDQPQLHRHYRQENPLPTPSSSQANLFSNLPSPQTRPSFPSTSIFYDHSPATHSSLSSWVSTLATGQSADQDVSGFSMHQDGPSADAPSTDVAIAPSLGGSLSSGQRKIYPDLKNTIGPYKLLRSIGHGSFSEVKMAVDTRTGDHVAIKVMSRAMIQSIDSLGISVRRESDLLKVR